MIQDVSFEVAPREIVGIVGESGCGKSFTTYAVIGLLPGTGRLDGGSIWFRDADEPTTALDVTVQAEILDLIRELQLTRRMAVLIVTHDWGVVADLCDRVVVMYAGQVVERASVRSVFATPLHPYTEALLASNPHLAPEAAALPTIPGTVPPPGSWPAGCRFRARCRHATAACAELDIALETRQPGHETRCLKVITS